MFIKSTHSSNVMNDSSSQISKINKSSETITHKSMKTKHALKIGKESEYLHLQKRSFVGSIKMLADKHGDIINTAIR